MIYTRYYYNKLNEKERKIYKAIYNGIMEYKPYVELPGIEFDDNLVGSIYHDVLWDNPHIFSVGEYAMWHAVEKGSSRIKMTTLCDRMSEKEYRRQINNEVNRILSHKELYKLDDFQKEVFVHDFIINNVQYDHSLGNNGARIEPYTIYGALIEKKAVCEGIAKTTKLLLNLLGVKCIVVTGEFYGEGHAWNIVKICDKSYNLDVTGDMGRVIHDRMMRYNFFNFMSDELPTHRLLNQHMLPKCDSIEYKYVVRVGGYVCNYEKLLNYVVHSLKKKKRCMYFKADHNTNDVFKGISFEDFEGKVHRALHDGVRKSGVSASFFVDNTGPGDIVNVEVKY